MTVPSLFRTRLLLLVALLFILLEGFSFAYVRQYSNAAGFNHHTRVHIMNYYNQALGNSGALNSTLMYFHWPLLKIEGLLKNRNTSMLHRHQYIEVHRSDNNSEDRLQTSFNRYSAR